METLGWLLDYILCKDFGLGNWGCGPWHIWDPPTINGLIHLIVQINFSKSKETTLVVSKSSKEVLKSSKQL